MSCIEGELTQRRIETLHSAHAMYIPPLHTDLVVQVVSTALSLGLHDEGVGRGTSPLHDPHDLLWGGVRLIQTVEPRENLPGRASENDAHITKFR